MANATDNLIENLMRQADIQYVPPKPLPTPHSQIDIRPIHPGTDAMCGVTVTYSTTSKK